MGERGLLSPTERTKRVIQQSMVGVTKWLPTLDFKLRVSAKNIIEYAFYEKPTASNRCLQEDTALNHNSLIMSLSNEVGRRLDSFSQTIPTQDKVVSLNEFTLSRQ